MIRKANHEDVEAIMAIVCEAQEALRQLNIDQWQDGYPSPYVIHQDIEKGVGNVLLDVHDKIIGYAAIVFTGEDAYLQLEPAMWHTEDRYVVVHRLCVAANLRRNGAATQLMLYAAQQARERGISAFRIDTHRGNIRMLSMLQKLGFEYCGIVHYPSGERLAYDLNIHTLKTL